MPDWVQLIGNWGFPVALSIYLLTRQEAKLAALTKAIESLNQTLAIMADRAARP